MQPSRPRYLLFVAATRHACQLGRWRFVLAPIGAGERLVAADVEPDVDRNRLELLAVVRGLEALGQPSQVTLLTRSRYVRRGIEHDLANWREASWRWESFGKLVPIRDLDLWQRVDRALAIHEIDCLRWQWDEVAHELQTSGQLSPTAVPADCPAGQLDVAARPPVTVPRLRPDRRLVRAGNRLSRRGAGRFGQGVLAAMTALGRPALSRTA
jgi:ribonuclease HI